MVYDLLLRWAVSFVLFTTTLRGLEGVLAVSVNDLTSCSTSAFGGILSNDINQSPCLVAGYLTAVCSSQDVFVPPVSSGVVYAASTNDSSCECNTVTYSMYAACAACQGFFWPDWTTYSQACASNVQISRYPKAIPIGTQLPEWAFFDVRQTVNGSFNLDLVSLLSEAPDVFGTASATTIATSTHSTTATVSPQARTGGHNLTSGAIAGIVIACLIGGALLSWTIMWCRDH